MSKAVLMVVGIVLVLMGLAGLVPDWEVLPVPTWEAVVVILVGLVAMYVSFADKQEA